MFENDAEIKIFTQITLYICPENKNYFHLIQEELEVNRRQKASEHWNATGKDQIYAIDIAAEKITSFEEIVTRTSV